MQMLNLIERWAEDPDGFSVIEKVANGGKGSGNFGHSGRPGEVGGSAPADKFSGMGLSLEYNNGDIIRGKDIVGKDIAGYVSYAYDVDENSLVLVMDDGERHIASKKDIETTFKANHDNFHTKEQAEALEDVFSMIEPYNENEKAYWQENCSPTIAKALAEELHKAVDSGTDLSWVALTVMNIGGDRVAELGLEPHLENGKFDHYTFTLGVTPRLMQDGEHLKNALVGMNKRGELTGANFNEVFAHEMGHIRMANIAQKQYGYGFTKENWESLNRGVVERACRNIGANSSLSKMGSSMSSYGRGSYDEAVAESFSKPSYSELTKEIVSVAGKVESKEIKLNAGVAPKKFKLCEGYPIAKLENEKIVSQNGGKGSGNFGHYGRPGEVGGSAPNPQNIPVNDKQSVSSAYLIKHKEEIMQRLGYNEGLFQAMVDDVRAIEIQDKAIQKADVEKWEKEYRPELEKLGISQGTIDTVDKIVREHASKNESTRTEGQAEAINNLISDTGVILDKKDETYMRNSVPEEMVKTIHEELNKAKKDGIDISQVQLQFVAATRQSGNCTLGRNGIIKIRLSRRENSDLDYFREKLEKNYNDKWWTAKDIGATIRHELGHAMVWQAIKDNHMSIYRYDEVARDTVKRANREWVRKTGKSQTELQDNKGFKYMGEYGTNNSHEALAEAYAGENYSDYTKILANELRWTKRYY